MVKDGRREETSTFAALSGCTYNGEVCFFRIEPKFVFKISVSAVDKYMYTWVSSAYK